MTSLAGRTAVVVGASRGLGRGIATALAATGAPVVGVSRTSTDPSDAPAVQVEIADAGDDSVAGRILDRYEPGIVVLVAGAPPHMGPLQEQTWETFSVNWESDVRMAFHWLRESLRKPLRSGSRVVVISSGAALNPSGSPLSGGYAGAKATQRLVTAYAQEESDRSGLGITFTCVLPQFAPETGIGAPAVRAYATRAGMTLDEFLAQLPFPVLTPETAGKAIVELLEAAPDTVAPAYGLNGAGLQPLR
jgi:NAD(P)-dependent dehydrogenase (short-subunit alcohol dehydrogenase family)